MPQNAGNEFYAGFLKSYTPSLSIFVTTTESDPVHFTVSNSSGTLSSGTAHSNAVTEVVLSSDSFVSNIMDRNKGFRVQATDARKTIVVYGMNYEAYSADGFLALPCTDSYYTENYTFFAVSTQWDNRVLVFLRSEVLLVACEDSTELTITPTQSIQIPSDLVREGDTTLTLASGESYTITMNRMQTFQFESLLDLTGSKVTSNKPIAFISGHECADVPVGVGYCDHLVEQLPPTLTWGRLFFTASLKSRISGEWYKVIGSRNATSVVVRCFSNRESPLTNIVIALDEIGSSQEFNVNHSMFCSVQSNKPVLLVQFAAGRSLDVADYGDPFMMVIPPVEQYKDNYTFVSQLHFANFLTITVPVKFYNPSMMFLNGTALTGTSWMPIYCSSVDICGYATQTSISVGASHVRHENPDAVFGVVVYGFQVGSSYGYPAGMKLNPIAGLYQYNYYA